MALNFNAEPYYDDYDENKKFYRMLFRPGYAVQARELTQLQTILQNQVTKFGNHVFKEGSMVIPGQISFDNKAGYVKLQSTYGSASVNTFLSNLEGVIIEGQTSGVRAIVKKAALTTSTDNATLIVSYLNSGSDNVTKTFADNEVISPVDTLLAEYTVQAISSSSTGNSSIVSIDRGIFYVKGIFALVDNQTLILNKYSNTPSARVGLTITESLVTSDDDESLLDNAQGSYNFAAPGADRYKIQLDLSSLSLDSTDDTDFVELMRIKNGSIQSQIRATEYSVLEQTLARRTYDESGDYTVKAFNVDVREHRNNNRGDWATSTSYIANDIVLSGGNYYTAVTSGTSSNTAPSHSVGEATDGVGGVTWLYTETPSFNRGVYTVDEGGDESKLAIGLEPGKAYVRGYEIEKVATTFVSIDKPRTTDDVVNGRITSRIGNYVLVTNVHNAPRIDNFATISLYNRLTSTGGTSSGTQIGTARARIIEYHSGTLGSSAAVYKLSLFDVQMESGYDFNRDVKQFYYNAGSTATNFTADISPVQTLLTGSVTASASTTITGAGTLFELDLQAGDYIYIGSSATTRRVTSVNSNTEIEVDSNVTVTGEVVYRITTQVLEPQNFASYFLFPNNFIETARNTSNQNAISYTVMERFTGTSSTVSGGYCTLTLSVGGGNDTFADETETDNYIVVDNTTGDILSPVSIARGTGNTQVVFTLNSAVANRSMVAICAVDKTGSGTEKTKTLTTSGAIVKSTAATATPRVVTLDKADGYKLLQVKMDTGTFASPTGTYSIDISDRYIFDDGQRSTYYDLASIVLKDGAAPPVAPIQIYFQYFTHSGSGDYFTVNSYTSTISYDKIPTFNGIRLSDVIDFRPRIDDTGSNFTGSGASSSLVPKRGIDVIADYSYYLGRKDKVSLDINGQFVTDSGVASLYPKDPADPSNAMVLFTLAIPPYSIDVSLIDIIKQDNKRYTMRDIGKLEKRIDTLEYYTSLSMLEQETSSFAVIDNEGLSRFKNGFIVDSFKGHTIGDTNSVDYRCAIDMENQELRSFYSMDNVHFIEVNTLDADRTSDGYQITGDLITLPYTNENFISQPYASRTENVNPFAVFAFIGNVILTPEVDEWFEVDRRPDLVFDIEGNYSTISTIAERQGVLGTVWNSWQTDWTGAPIGVNQAQRVEGNNLNTYEITARQVGQSRSGIRTAVVAQFDREVIGDRVLNTTIVPYIRSRNILFLARKLKPETQFFPYFEGVDITDYVTPATKMSFNAISSFSSEFDYKSNAGGDSDESARLIDSVSEVALNYGDVVYVQTRSSTSYTKSNSPAKGVVVFQEDISGTKSIYVVNIEGTFQSGDVIEGSISGSRGTLTSTPTVKVAGDDLVTNAYGDVVGLFDIPNTDIVRFRTGTREFLLTDSSTNANDYTSRGRASYSARGILETRQLNVNSVRNALIVNERISDSRTIIQTSERLIGSQGLGGGDGGGDGGGGDPLSQTFLVQSRGGAFLTKIDLFFAAKSEDIPVTIEIREVVNGYPGSRVLPFSRVTVSPADVNISENTVTVEAEDRDYGAPDTPTTFTFPSPVYVEDGTEYALVVIADTQDYRLWISQMGEVDILTDRLISAQPYTGVLFKSQNATAWTADQYQDLKFNIYRAQFSTSAGSVEFTNDILSNVTLESNPIQTYSGTGKVRIYHNNHGMTTDCSVTISGATAVNGITTGQLNTTHSIDSVDVDSYIITTAGTATSTGFGGGNSVSATRNIAFSSMQPVVQFMNFSDTILSFLTKTTTGKSINGSGETAYNVSSYESVAPNLNNLFSSQRLVASQINETNNLSGNKSLYLKALLQTDNANISPVLDMQRISAILVNNKVNNPSLSASNDSDLDTRTIVSSNTNVAADGSEISSADSTTQNAFKTASVGKYITTSGFSNSENNGTWLVTDVNSTDGTLTIDGSLTTEAATASVTITIADHYVDEIAPIGSSSFSKYVTKRITLETPSTYLRIKLAADIPPSADIKVYYRTLDSASGNSFNNVKYTEITADSALVRNSDGMFYDVDYSATDLPPFDSLGVKIVFTTTNGAQVARVKDLRVIACS